jgi:hypothetical protein
LPGKKMAYTEKFNARQSMRKRKIKFPPPLPQPVESGRIYLHIAPRDVAVFRFLLEAEDNLGYMSVLDRWRALLKVTYSPHQARQMRACLHAMREMLSFEIIGEASFPAQAHAEFER